MSIEKLKYLEEEAMDNIDSDIYDEITSNVLEEGERWIYTSGYIDGLQTAIRVMSEDDSSMSYTVEIEDIFDDEEDN